MNSKTAKSYTCRNSSHIVVNRYLAVENGLASFLLAGNSDFPSEMRCKDYDLPLSDIQMPGTNGFELLKHALQNTSPDIPKKVTKLIDGELKEVKVGTGEAIQQDRRDTHRLPGLAAQADARLQGSAYRPLQPHVQRLRAPEVRRGAPDVSRPRPQRAGHDRSLPQ